MKTTSFTNLAGVSRAGVRDRSYPRHALWRKVMCIAVSLLFSSAAAYAEYNWSVFAGKDSGIGTADDRPDAPGFARFFAPAAITADANGNLYVVDIGNHNVRKIMPDNPQTRTITLAGQAGFPGERDDTWLRAQFNSPQGVAVDTRGNVYVADSGGNTIRLVTPGTVVTTYAGRADIMGSADGDRLAARFKGPAGLVFDAAGNLFIADKFNSVIRKIDPAGHVTTFAGTSGQQGTANGVGSAARFFNPHGLAIDAAQNLYVTDGGNHTIRKITPAGVVTTVAGMAGLYGNRDGPAAQSLFYYPAGIAVDKQGVIYVSESNNTALRLISNGVVTSLPSSIWDQETPGLPRQFNTPLGLVIAPNGVLYVADTGNHAIRRVSGGLATTYTGYPGTPFGRQDGIGNAARFDGPQGITTDAAGNVYLADSANNIIRKITPSGVVTTVPINRIYSSRIYGPPDRMVFLQPVDLALDSTGNYYILQNDRLVKVTPAGEIIAHAQDPFHSAQALALDRLGNVYIADTNQHVIAKVTPDHLVTIIAGVPGVAGFADGASNRALFNQPSGIAVDGSGSIFVADSNNQVIRKITAAGLVTTLAGWPGRLGNTDGTGAAAQFYQPHGLALGLDGSLIVADTFNHQIRQVTMAGVVTTLGGFPGAGGSRPGIYRDANFSAPYHVAVSPTGLIYVSEAIANVVAIGTTGPRLDVFADGDSLAVGGGYSFGGVTWRGGSLPIGFGLADTGLTTFSNLAVRVDGPQASDFVVGPLYNSYITPTGGTGFSVTFRPSASGVRSANLRIISVGGGINELVFPLTGTGLP